MDSRWYKNAMAHKSSEIEMRLPSSQIKECQGELIGLTVSKEMSWKM
jgi:hypothetical protein